MRSPALLVSLLPFVVAVLPLGCSRDQAAADAGAEAGAAPLSALTTLARAEDQRRAKDVTEAMTSSHDVTVRRRAARALARIADEASIPGLMRALSDEDPQAIGWGAYGLGAACKGKEDAHVSALVARSVSFDDVPGFDRLWSLIVLLAVTMLIALAIERTRLWIIFGGSILMLLLLAAGLFMLLHWSARTLFRSKAVPE